MRERLEEVARGKHRRARRGRARDPGADRRSAPARRPLPSAESRQPPEPACSRARSRRSPPPSVPLALFLDDLQRADSATLYAAAVPRAGSRPPATCCSSAPAAIPRSPRIAPPRHRARRAARHGHPRPRAPPRAAGPRGSRADGARDHRRGRRAARWSSASLIHSTDGWQPLLHHASSSASCTIRTCSASIREACRWEWDSRPDRGPGDPQTTWPRCWWPKSCAACRGRPAICCSWRPAWAWCSASRISRWSTASHGPGDGTSRCGPPSSAGFVLPLSKDYVLLDPHGGPLRCPRTWTSPSASCTTGSARRPTRLHARGRARRAPRCRWACGCYEDGPRHGDARGAGCSSSCRTWRHAPERIGPAALRLELADLHLKAGRRAKASGAYRTACELFRDRWGAASLQRPGRRRTSGPSRSRRNSPSPATWPASSSAAASGFSTAARPGTYPAPEAPVCCVDPGERWPP